MAEHELETIARALVAPGKGILAVITPAIVLVLSLLSGKVAGFFTSFASIIP